MTSTSDQTTQTTPYEVTSAPDKATKSAFVKPLPSTSYMLKTTLEKTTNPTTGIETLSTKEGDTTRSDTTKQPTITSTTQSKTFESTTQEVTTEDLELTILSTTDHKTKTSGQTTQTLDTLATTTNLQTIKIQ
ncbi:salivary glue protein Sgs-3-like [Mytilus edulis]|uniref:salivary glue protein Sgs-3-like n=1 Tax=Mytilus edulis TaxID=6550 RepID=UPI0039EE886D